MRVLICLILLSAPVFSQSKPKPAPFQPCPVTIDKVPLIRGLRLGQAYSYLQTALPQQYSNTIDIDELRLKRVYLTPHSLVHADQLVGIETLTLTYMDDSLVRIEAVYDTSIKWQSNLHFVAAIAQQLNLPREGWQERDPSYLICQGFVVQVDSARFMPKLQMWDLTFPDELSKRKANAEEQKRARFRP